MPNNIENLAIDNSKDITNLRMNRKGRVQYSIDGGKSYSNLNRDEWLNILITALTKGCTCEDGSTIVPGENGADGKSAYDIWLELGNTGSEQDFLNSLIGKNGSDGEKGEPGKDGLDGKSSYDIWLELGNEGTEEDFINSLKGKDGEPGQNGQNGKDGSNGQDGYNGKSAYEIWKELGNTGTEEDFIKSLIGKDGNDGQNGKDGVDGKSTYEIWLSLGNTGSEEEFINSLKGKDGEPGQDGEKGEPGNDGVDGKSTYQIWKELGNEGTEEDFINSLKGKDGEPGQDGQDGKAGQDGIDGLSPTIGDNGNWFIGEQDTGVKANPLTKSESLGYIHLSLPLASEGTYTQEIPKGVKTIINFSNILESKNIETNPENNSVILKAGKTYMMQAVFELGGTESGQVNYGFYNITLNQYLKFKGKVVSCDSGQNENDLPLIGIYTPTQDEEIQVVVTDVYVYSEGESLSIFGNNASTHFSYNGWIIQQIGESIVLDPLEHINSETGIEDTPVGHIIAHMGVNAPAHYLICDGSEYNISDYPYLVEHITNEFGSVNYFGGDGTTTFAVPDLRGEFLRGTGTNSKSTESNTYSKGSNVGVHQEASKQMLIAGVPSTDGIARMNFYIDTSLTSTATKNTDKKYLPVTMGASQIKADLDFSTTTATDFYSYSSRPTNTAVLYCIKYEPTYFMKTDAHYMGICQTILFEGQSNEVQLSEDVLNYEFIRVYIKLGGENCIVQDNKDISNFIYIDIPTNYGLINKEFSTSAIRSDSINDNHNYLFVASILMNTEYLLYLTQIGIFDINNGEYLDRLNNTSSTYNIIKVIGIKGESEVTE